MTDYASIAKTLTESLKLRVAPVAVCLSDEPPQGVSGPSKAAAAGCMFWEWGAKDAIVTSAKDHANCAVGMYTHHMPLATASQQEDLNDCLKVFGDLGYVRPEDIPGIPVLKEEAKYVVYAPLASTPLAPATVLLFANSRQSLTITDNCASVRKFPAEPDNYGSSPAGGTGCAASLGTARLRRDTSGGQFRKAGAEPGLLRSARLPGCADR